ncbi:MAG: hypothetical protein SGJ27_26490 [Candidatus Melainabacteria bacterium]|nr:hypothetical protein [Candidatus Melainabacteria bacterium]
MPEAKNPEQVDAKSDAKIAAPDTTGSAPETLSNSVQDLMKEASKSATGDAAKAHGTSSEDQLGNIIAEKLGKSSQEKLGQIANEIKNGAGGAVAEGMKSHDKNNMHLEKMKGGMAIGEIGIGSINKQVTDADRKEAKEQLEKGISGLVPEADRKLQVQMQNAIVDGDITKFKDAVKAVGDNPEKLAKMVKEVNDQLNRNEQMGGVELSMDSKGNVLLYGEKGNTAVSVNPKTGDTTLRAVDRQADGSVVLKDGEIINKKPEEVMKGLGDVATRSITDSPFHKISPFEKPPFNLPPGGGDFNPFKPHPKLPQPGDARPGVPGTGSGTIDKTPWNKDKGQLDFTPLKELQEKIENKKN